MSGKKIKICCCSFFFCSIITHAVVSKNIQGGGMDGSTYNRGESKIDTEIFKAQGFDELIERLNGRLGNGKGLVYAQVENDFIKPNLYSYQKDNQPYKGKRLTFFPANDPVDNESVSRGGHADVVGQIFYGNIIDQYGHTKFSLSHTPEVEEIYAFKTNAFREFLAEQINSSSPEFSKIDVINISSTFGNGLDLSIKNLEELTYESNTFVANAQPANAIGSGSHTTWNCMTVGTFQATSTHGRKTHYLNKTEEGRIKPDIVAENYRFSSSSYSTPVVASAAGLLIDYVKHLQNQSKKAKNKRAFQSRCCQSRNIVIKAALLAGARKSVFKTETFRQLRDKYREMKAEMSSDKKEVEKIEVVWENSLPEQPLSKTYGAGFLNVNYSHRIIEEKQVFPNKKSWLFGWGLETIPVNKTHNYYLESNGHQGNLSVILTWNRKPPEEKKSKQGNRNRLKRVAGDVADMQLQLFKRSRGKWKKIAMSDDPDGNVEHLYIPVKSKSNERYKLVVKNKKGKDTVPQETYAISWALHKEKPWKMQR